MVAGNEPLLKQTLTVGTDPYQGVEPTPMEQPIRGGTYPYNGILGSCYKGWNRPTSIILPGSPPLLFSALAQFYPKGGNKTGPDFHVSERQEWDD